MIMLSVGVSAVSLSSNLVDCWSFDNTYNSSLNKNNFSTQSNTGFNSSVKKLGTYSVMNLNNADGYISLGTYTGLPISNNPSTISAWIYRTGLDTSIGGFFGYTDTVGANLGMYVDGSSNLHLWGVGGDEVTGTQILTGQWYHIAYSYTGTKVIFWQNGVNVYNYTINKNLNSGYNYYRLLMLGTDTNGAWRGNIDEYSIFNKTLDADEITALYNSGSGVTCEAMLLTDSLLVNWNGYSPANNSVVYNGQETQTFYFNTSGASLSNCTFYSNSSAVETKYALANGTIQNFSITRGAPLSASINHYITCTDGTNYANSSIKTLQYNLTQGVKTNLSNYLSASLTKSPFYVNVSTTSFDGAYTTCTVRSNNTNAVCTESSGYDTSFNIGCSVPYPTVTDISFYGTCNTSTLNYNSTFVTLGFNYTAGIFTNLTSYSNVRSNFDVSIDYNGINGTVYCGIYDNSSKVSCSENTAVGGSTTSTCTLSSQIIRDYISFTPYCRNATSIFNSSARTIYVGNAGQINFTARFLNGTSMTNFNISYSLGTFQGIGATLYAINYFGTAQYEYYEPVTVAYPVNITLINDSQSYEFTIYETNAINFTFREETTNALINTTVNFEMISEIFSSNYTTSTGYYYLSLMKPSEYVIRYSAENYSQRLYYFTLFDRTVNNLTLYLINDALPTSVTATVLDQSGTKLEGAIIKVLKYDLSSNSYNVMEILKTNFEGQSILNIVLNTEFYKFIIEYPSGTIREETNPTYIYSDTLNFQILIGDAVGTGFENKLGVDHNLSFNEATNNFRYTYSDTQNTAYQGCLKVYVVSGTELIFYDSSCSQSSSGTILINVSNTTGTTYLAKSYIYFNPNSETYLTSFYKTFTDDKPIGKYGIWIIMIMVVVFASISIWNPVFAAIITPLPISLGAYMGLIDIGLTAIISMHIISLIIAFILAERTE